MAQSGGFQSDPESQVGHFALLHGGRRLQRGFLTTLLQNAFEDFEHR